MHNGKKRFCCNLQHAWLLSKNNLVQKRAKVMTIVTFGTVFVGLLTARKNTGACTISALSCRTASCRARQCWKRDQKYKTKTKIKSARPRPRPVWQMTVGLSKTAIFGDSCGYFFGNVPDKTSNITWRYATPCLPVIDCKMNDLEWSWVSISRQNPFSTSVCIFFKGLYKWWLNTTL